MEDQVQHLMGRLNRIERALRRTRAVGITLVAGLALVPFTAMMRADAPKTIVKDLALVDGEGKTRARLFYDEQQKGPKLEFYGADDKVKLQLAVEESLSTHDIESTLTYFGKDDNPQMILKASGGVNYLAMLSEGRQGEVSLYSAKNGAKLELCPAWGTSKGFPVRLSAMPWGSDLTLFDKFQQFPNGQFGYQSRIVVRNSGDITTTKGTPEIIMNDEQDSRVFFTSSGKPAPPIALESMPTEKDFLRRLEERARELK